MCTHVLARLFTITDTNHLLVGAVHWVLIEWQQIRRKWVLVTDCCRYFKQLVHFISGKESVSWQWQLHQKDEDICHLVLVIAACAGLACL